MRKRSGEPGRKVVSAPTRAHTQEWLPSELPDELVGPLRKDLLPGFWAPNKKLPDIEPYMVELAVGVFEERPHEAIEHNALCAIFADLFSDESPIQDPAQKKIFLTKFAEAMINHLIEDDRLVLESFTPITYKLVVAVTHATDIVGIQVPQEGEITLQEFFAQQIAPVVRALKESNRRLEQRATAAESAAAKDRAALEEADRRRKDAETGLERLRSKIAQLYTEAQSS